ncbi:MAG: hypothetical protein JW951_08340 [Lentisphaerae bacterium]|nr:hypothetical protein [Lentisphaerota bacterium]
MIFDPAAETEALSPVAHHIVGHVDEVCGGTLSIDADAVEDLARAVEAYLAEGHAGEFVDSRYLVLLACRALSAVGEDRAARRLLLYGTGLVLPSEWEVTGGKAVWVLDLRQITVRAEERLELVLFNCLSGVLGSIAEIWDASRGRGVLGLRHVSGAAQALLGGGSAPGKVRELAREIKTLCALKLSRIGDERGWTHVPEILDLDV